jgi:hypothetical protein
MKKYILILFTVISFGQASNQMVSFTQAQSLGFALNAGQSHVTSNQCMAKSEALAKYSINSAPMNSYASNQLVPRSLWTSGFVGQSLQLIDTTAELPWDETCSYLWLNPITKYTKTGLKVWDYVWSADESNGIYGIYNDVGCTSRFQIAGKSFKVLENGVFKRILGESHVDNIVILENCSAWFNKVSFNYKAASQEAQICTVNNIVARYTNNPDFNSATALYTNSAGTTFAAAGYYLIEGTAQYRFWGGTSFTAGSSTCSQLF